MPKRSKDSCAPARADTWLRLSELARQNRFAVRTLYRFARDGMKVARPERGRVIYGRQDWLDQYLVERARG
jgi:hypothetical protein